MWLMKEKFPNQIWKTGVIISIFRSSTKIIIIQHNKHKNTKHQSMFLFTLPPLTIHVPSLTTPLSAPQRLPPTRPPWTLLNSCPFDYFYSNELFFTIFFVCLSFVTFANSFLFSFSLSLLFSSTDKQKQYAKNIQNQQRHLHAAKVHKATQTKRSCQTKASTLCILSLCCKSTSRSQKEQSRLQNDGNQ